jgi:gamma-glutamyltranspeptidase/glutathione hydrolase
MLRVRISSLAFGPLLAAGLVALAPGGLANAETPGATQAVSTEHPLATQAAIETLKRGGNAADAAVVASLVAGVVNPKSSGLGGGGFALIRKPGGADVTVVDFRETAPRAVDAAALARRPLPFEERGKLVGVPGEPKGLFEIARRFGRKPWAELVAKAEQVAKRGFAVNAFLAEAFTGPAAADLRKEPSILGLFFPGGRPAFAGRVIRNPKLGATLKRLGTEGPGPFYEGVIASEIVATAKSAGSGLSLEDLKQYRVIDRKPIRATFGEYTVFSMPPPSSGGILVGQMLGLFTPVELERLGWGSGALTHLLAEGFRASLADRFRYVGDPDLVPVETSRLLEPARLAKIRQRISIDRTHRLQRFVAEEHGTHHLAFADADGMMVSLTTTVNRTFGAKLVTPESAIPLNDELDDFNTPAELARLGLRDGPNLPRPGARPTSSMTPTIVLRSGRPELVIGGSGGTTIATNVAQLLIGRIVFEKSPEELVKHPRFYVGTRNSTLLLDPGTSPAVSADLARRGEIVEPMPFLTSGVQMVSGEPGSYEAGADPRKQGSAMTLP